MPSTYLPTDFLPILVQFLLAFLFIGGTLVATHYLGPNRKSRLKGEAFECGIESVGDARTPISVKYFLVAIVFVLFDVEVIFMYPWAVNFQKLGMLGFTEMLLFIALLLSGFYYVIKKGVLRWEE